MLFCVILGCKFKKVSCKNKILKLERKNVLLGFFKLKIGKSDCEIWNQHARIFQNAKNCGKQRKNQNWDQNSLNWLFWAVSLKKYCHI